MGAAAPLAGWRAVALVMLTRSLLLMGLALVLVIVPGGRPSFAAGGMPGGGKADGKGAAPYILVLGVAQDGGAPQAGDKTHPGWADPSLRRRVTCLAIVDPVGTGRWLLDCTPDFREQLQALDRVAPVEGTPGLAGIFLTHAHIGHYTGLMFLGHESMGGAQMA